MEIDIKKKIIRLYPKTFMHKLYAKIKFRPGNAMVEVEKYVPKTGKILDVGCGVGYLIHYLYSKSKARKLIGIDFDKKRIDTALYSVSSNSNASIKFELKDVSDFPSGSFDCILIYDVIHHIKKYDFENLLIKCYNSLNYNGCLIIKDIDPANNKKIMISYFIDYLNMLLGLAKKGPLNFFYKSTVISLLQKTGFNNIFSSSIKKSLISEHIIYKCIKENS